MGRSLGPQAEPKITTMVLIRGRQEGPSQERRCDKEAEVKERKIRKCYTPGLENKGKSQESMNAESLS